MTERKPTLCLIRWRRSLLKCDFMRVQVGIVKLQCARKHLVVSCSKSFMKCTINKKSESVGNNTNKIKCTSCNSKTK